MSRRVSSPRATHLGAEPFGPRLELERFRLDNGLTLLVLEDHAAPVLAYHSWFKVGSASESPGKTGLAHFFEHLMFHETKRFPEGELDRRIEEAGGETNAATWLDWTVYHEELPASGLGLAMRLEADRMNNLQLGREVVNTEREIVMNERRMAVEDDVAGAANERLWTLAFGEDHPYGWPTIGWMRDIEGYRVQDCRQFYRRFYGPDRVTVVVAGDVRAADVARRVAKAYGDLRPVGPLAEPVVTTPSGAREHSAKLSWPTPSERLALGWLAPGYAHFDHAVLMVIEELLGGGRSGRLRRRLVEELEIATEAAVSLAPLRHASLFEIWLAMREGESSSRASSVIDEELHRLAAEPVRPRELERVANRIELGLLSSVETVSGKAHQIGFAETVVGQPSHAFTRLDEVRRVRPQDIARVAAQIFRPRRRARVLVRPEAA